MVIIYLIYMDDFLFSTGFHERNLFLAMDFADNSGYFFSSYDYFGYWADSLHNNILRTERQRQGQMFDN